MTTPYRGSQYIGGSAKPTVCSRGHKLTPDNLVKVGPGNGTRCKVCRQRIVAESRKRKRAAVDIAGTGEAEVLEQSGRNAASTAPGPDHQPLSRSVR